MSLKNLFLLTAAIGFGLYVSSRKTSLGSQYAHVDDGRQWILVPAKELPVGTKLERENLAELIRKKWVNKTEVPPNAILKEDELIGKEVTQSLKVGDCFMSSNVTIAKECYPPDGKHQYTLKLPYECVGPWVRPGREVDVVCTHRPSGTSVVRHVPLLHEMLVMSVDYRDKPGPGIACMPMFCTVTLSASLEEAHWLQLAQDAGAHLRLLVRSGTEVNICRLPDDELYELFKGSAKDKQNRQESR